MTDYWEPWQPAVGDRVRVRLSGECGRMESGRYVHTHIMPGADGHSGIVISTNAGGDQHPYHVRFDEPYLAYGTLVLSNVYAAIELEPL